MAIKISFPSYDLDVVIPRCSREQFEEMVKRLKYDIHFSSDLYLEETSVVSGEERHIRIMDRVEDTSVLSVSLENV